MRSSLRVIVSGLIAQYPIGGVTWDYLQYLLGLAALGHDVYYVEDSEQWPYDPVKKGTGQDGAYNAAYLASIMARFGFAERWAYRFPGGSLPEGTVFPEVWYGLSDERRRTVVRTADLLINVSSGIGDPARYGERRRLVYVDTDPVFTQIRAVTEPDFRNHLNGHHAHFSYGEGLAAVSDAAAGLVPATGHAWRPMRKPIAVTEWRPSTPHRDVFTTVMNWTSYPDVAYGGRSYGQKDEEFVRFADLPARVAPTVLELAVGAGRTRRLPRGRLLEQGWRLVDPMEVAADLDGYRRYIESSKAEWTVAKSGYVIGQVGWFSGRSACYLAAGRPVVVQDTGLTGLVPTGEGILTFRTPDEAAAAIEDVDAHYSRHAAAARAIAHDCFDAAMLVGRLIDGAAGGTAP